MVCLLAYFTYLHGYAQPNGAYWDENYYIADAQKELNGVFYMQFHPPLGKLLIGLGEMLIDANEYDDQFLGTDHGKDFPENFSFAGYRFFPVFLGWLSAPLLFLTFFLLTRKHLLALFLSFLYIFDNALIVHSRGAMLDAPMLTFAILTILLCIIIVTRRWKRLWALALLSAAFGCAFALVITTKMQGAYLFLLFPAAALRFVKDWRRLLTLFCASSLGFLVIFVAVWQIHFSLGSTINPELSNEGYYRASQEYKTILQEGRNRSLAAFPVMLTAALKFIPQYNQGIPDLDMCKWDENGSPVWWWPLGGKCINYRWATNDNVHYQYLTLVPNVAVWFISLVTIIIGSVFTIVTMFSAVVRRRKPRANRLFIALFLLIIFAFMGHLSLMTRVLFLPTYFLPLIVSFFIAALLLNEYIERKKRRLSDHTLILAFMFIASCIVLSYQFFRPLTYYEPLTDKQVTARNLFPWWDVHCAQCERGAFWCPLSEIHSP